MKINNNKKIVFQPTILGVTPPIQLRQLTPNILFYLILLLLPVPKINKNSLLRNPKKMLEKVFLIKLNLITNKIINKLVLNLHQITKINNNNFLKIKMHLYLTMNPLNAPLKETELSKPMLLIQIKVW